MDSSRRTFALAGASALGSLAFGGRAFADAPAAIRAVLVQELGPACRVTLGLDRQASARTLFLQSPDRFVIDVADARLLLPQGLSGQGPGAGLVSRYRFAAQPGGAARVVLDLAGPANLVRQELGGRRSPEMSFELAPSHPLADTPQRRELPGRGRARTIVVDAGHGGRDPGAIGATGVREKDVVLAVGLELRGALAARGYRVALTRDDDRFVPLEDRVQFARAQQSDLFVSLHADSHANPEAHGASVYTLSERGADRAQNLMSAHNWTIDLGEAPRAGVAHDILIDLYQRETTNRSAQFAQTLIPRLAAVGPLLRNTHRSAGFFVLLAPDVPAVLVETGFLSNVADERRLNDQRERQAMARAMADAVDAFFAVPQVYAGGA